MSFCKLLLALALAAPAAAARVDAGDAASVLEAIDQGSEVSLTDNIVLDKGMKITVSGETMIAGNGKKITSKGEDMFVVKDGAMLMLEDLTLTFDSKEKKPNGCVVVEAGGSLAASDVTFSKCEAHEDGGGINAMAGAKEIMVEDSTFEECKSDVGAGGGIASKAMKTTISGTTFTKCSSKSYGAAFEIDSLGGTAEISDCVITKNTDTKPRSTVYLGGLADLSFTDTEVTENENRGAGIVILSKLTDASFSGSTFSNNKNRAIRAFTLFDGTKMFDDCTFSGNTADTEKYGLGGAAIFVKESPHARIVLKDSTFSGNKVDYGSEQEGSGGALYLNANAEIMGCTFKDNSADVGGAVYVAPAVSHVAVMDTEFKGNEATTAGGAVAAVATSSDAMFPGALSLTGVTGSGNKCSAADGDKTGGSFAKINGGMVSLRDTDVAGIVGLRFTTAKVYEDVSTGGFTVADSADVDVYCGDDSGITVTAVGDEDEESVEVTESGFNALGKFSITEHESCPGAASTVCEDSKTWTKKDDDAKDCAWVAGKPKTRCAAKDENAVFAFEECKVACGVCGKTCADDDSWASANDEDKDCAWAKRFINRCAAVGEDGMYGYESCAKSCHACDASA
mmetsp:Transcript_14182/g.42271  ORF Transcript_14182/g.42271 Transcript_14182/m.42271 type:complete len:624 (-) Transcript_14182:152-2023(-)